MDVGMSTPRSLGPALKLDSDGLLDGKLDGAPTKPSDLSAAIPDWLHDASHSDLQRVVLHMLGSNPSSRTPSISFLGERARGSSTAGTPGLIDRSLARSTTNILPDMGRPAHGHGSTAAGHPLARHHVAAAAGAGKPKLSTKDLPVGLDFSRLFEQKGPFSSIGALSGQASDETKKELFERLCLRKVSKQYPGHGCHANSLSFLGQN